MQSEKAIGNGYHIQLMNGILFVVLFASAAYQLSQWHYISLLGISPLIVGIVLGMIYGNTLRLHLPVYWLPGILFSSKVLLRAAIVLYGFRLTAPLRKSDVSKYKTPCGTRRLSQRTAFFMSFRTGGFTNLFPIL